MKTRDTQSQANDSWIWNTHLNVYYNPSKNSYALPGQHGGWTYLSPDQLAARNIAVANPPTAGDSWEEGEVFDNVGWGGLMDPEQLAKEVEKREAALNQPQVLLQSQPQQPPPPPPPRHPAYGNDPPPVRHPAYDTSPQKLAPAHGEFGRDRGHYRPGDWGERYGERDRDWDRGDRRDRAAASKQGFGYVDGGSYESGDSRAPSPDPGAHLLRLVVTRSKALAIGGVAVLDARPGGIHIGRDRPDQGAAARVRVREMEVSKTHALVYYGNAGSDDPAVEEGTDEDEGWFVVDLGSTLGTYVAHKGEPQATRLSNPKESSKPYPLHHDSRLTVGTTTFIAHIHDDWPCEACKLSGNEEIRLEDGTPTQASTSSVAQSQSVTTLADPPALDSAQRRGQRQWKRKLEMDALRDNLLGEDGKRSRTSSPHEPSHYIDRSAQRRRLHSDRHPTSAPSTGPTTPVTPGFHSSTITAHPNSGPPFSAPTGPSQASRAMLAMQGWTEGRGLGRDGAGRAEPVVAVLRNERAGLGVRGAVKEEIGAKGKARDERGERGDRSNWRTRGKERRWKEALGQ